MAEQETIVDIIAEKRREADYIEETARGLLKAGENYDGIAYTESDLESALDLADTKRKEADRLEAAHRRERVVCARMREAIEKVIEISNKEWDAFHEIPAMWEMWEICTAALAATEKEGGNVGRQHQDPAGRAGMA